MPFHWRGKDDIFRIRFAIILKFFDVLPYNSKVVCTFLLLHFAVVNICKYTFVSFFIYLYINSKKRNY